MGRIVAVVPVGPTHDVGFVADTLESVRYWTDDARVILVDDSRVRLAEPLGRRFGAEVITTAGNGSGGGLYLTLSLGFEAALEEPFDVLLRMDTDALVAARFEDEAIAHFAAHPEVGCVGSYRYGYDGGRRTYSWAGRRIIKAALDLRAPRTARDIIRLVLEAKRHGYSLGESVLGGVCLYSHSAVAALQQSGHLGIESLRGVWFHEDHIFSLALVAAGFKLGELGRREDGPLFGAKHVGLPASPADLIAEGKCLVHSVRSWGHMDEAQIRAEFRSARSDSLQVANGGAAERERTAGNANRSSD